MKKFDVSHYGYNSFDLSGYKKVYNHLGHIVFVKFDDITTIPVIPITLAPTILSSHYFISSWLKHSDMTMKNFDSIMNQLITKDKAKDKEWLPVTHLIAFDTKSKAMFLVEIATMRYIFKNFDNVSFMVLRHIFGKNIDFFIPRSVWWKSFLILEDRYNLANIKKYLY